MGLKIVGVDPHYLKLSHTMMYPGLYRFVIVLNLIITGFIFSV